MSGASGFNNPPKGFHVFHRKEGAKRDGSEDREVRRNAVDYGDGNVMVQYTDDAEVAIVPISEIVAYDPTTRKEGK